MKKHLLLLICLILAPFIVNGQMVLDNFDTELDTVGGGPWTVYGNDDANKTYIIHSLETANVKEGAGALRVEWQNQCYDQWGGWNKQYGFEDG